MIKLDRRSLGSAALIGVCVGVFIGAVESRPSEIGIPEDKYYGYPLRWLVTHTGLPDEFRFFELLADCLLWFVIVLIVFLLVKKLAKV